MSSDGLQGPAFRLMYRSHSLIPAESSKAELGALFSVARSNNKKLGITGALMLDAEWFVQTLEGDEAAVRSLFERISTDPRHDDVAVLDTATVPARAFPHWSMAQVSTAGKDDVYLIAHEDGIAPATPRRRSPEQDAALDTMRAAVSAQV
ncbi:BLUF domain-containing protein [uncultured Jatrophihabitans sp.]|uniref:BLUF domain-containing protein n=1 Tax=uncultured Jatrophihabitans sp. TaxID=1610747 RepID=UPI0035C9627E